MQEEYFVPEIEDIRVGYEIEIKDINKDEWTNVKMNRFLTQEFLKVGINSEFNRVSYLTKEKIEAEEGITPLEYEGVYRKGNHWLRYNFNKKILSIIPIDPVKEENYWHEVRFIGVIKSINEFRYICKLLNIK